jgi:hypothetical protein
MPCRFPLIALLQVWCGRTVRAPQRAGKPRPDADDATRIEEYKP